MEIYLYANLICAFCNWSLYVHIHAYAATNYDIRRRQKTHPEIPNIPIIGGPKSWNKSFYSKRKEERVKTSDDRDNWWAFDEVGVHGFFLQPPPCAPHLAESSSIISIIWCFHPFFLSFAVEALVSVLIAIPTPATLCMKEERSESCDRGCDN